MKKVIMIDEEAYNDAVKEEMKKTEELAAPIQLMMLVFAMNIKHRLFSGNQDNENGFEEGQENE